jgi:hypothetical protein
MQSRRAANSRVKQRSAQGGKARDGKPKRGRQEGRERGKGVSERGEAREVVSKRGRKEGGSRGWL